MTKVWLLVALVLPCVIARPSDSGEQLRESRSSPGFKGEHRSAPAQPEVANLNYYGGAGGNVLVFHPTLGLSPSRSSGQVAGFRDDQEGGEGGDGGGGDDGGGDSVSVQLPPPGASIAEVRPVGLSIAGPGGVAASKPTGTAVVGPGGLAIARPIATAIAGIPPGVLLGPGPEGPAQNDGRATKEGYQLVGPSKQPTNKYGLVPLARTMPAQYVNSVQQPLLIYSYPVAYY